MKNFIVRTITGVFFVAAIVVSFLNPMAMVFLFALVTGLTIWEFCGLVNERPYVQVNQFISTVAGVYLFLAMAGHCSGYVNTDTVFIPYLITIVYLLIAELYLKAKDPINNWAYTMLPQMYIALPFSMLNVLAFPQAGSYSFVLPLSVFIFLWMNDTGAYLCGSLLGRHKLFPRVSPGKSWEGSIGGGLLVVGVAILIWWLLDKTQQHSDLDMTGPYCRGVWHLGRLGGESAETHAGYQGQRQYPARSWRHAGPLRFFASGYPCGSGLSVYYLADVKKSLENLHNSKKTCYFALSFKH